MLRNLDVGFALLRLALSPLPSRLPLVAFAFFLRRRIPYHCPGVTFSDRGPWAGWITALISAPSSNTAAETKK